MAGDMFLKIQTIDGESTDAAHKDWIEISSFSWGLTQKTSGSGSSGGARSAERADHSDFNVMKTMDKATPKIALALLKGEHIPEVIVSLHRAVGDKQKYMEYKMSDVMISSYQESGASGASALPMESLSFNYGKIECIYTCTDHKTGKPAGDVKSTWDVTKNDGQ
jgi:type VI secretion system secreted protein Hcp